MTASELKQTIRDEATAAGFDAVGFTHPHAIPEAAERLHQFLDAGHHGDMAWMADTALRRGDPAQLWPQARSIVMLGLNYGPDDDPMALLADRTRAVISVWRARLLEQAAAAECEPVVGRNHRRLAGFQRYALSHGVADHRCRESGL